MKNKTQKSLFHAEYLLLFICCFGIIMNPAKVIAQFKEGKIEDFNEIKSRKLIVITEVEDPQVLKDIENGKHIANPTAALVDYKKYIAEYNQNMKTVIETCWKFSKNGIEYKTYEEVMSLSKEKNREYAFLYCGSSTLSSDRVHYMLLHNLYYDLFSDSKQDVNRGRASSGGCTFFKITLIERPRTTVYSCALTNILPSKADIEFGIMSMESAAAAKTRKEEGAKVSRNDQWYEEFDLLAKKILLIREDWIDTKLGKDKIATVYPYKYEVVSKEKFDQIVLARKPGYAMVILQPIQNSGIMQLVVDLENGKRITCCTPRQNGYEELVTKKSFEAFVSGL
jgi:hypothetical protein